MVPGAITGRALDCQALTAHSVTLHRMVAQGNSRGTCLHRRSVRPVEMIIRRTSHCEGKMKELGAWVEMAKERDGES